METENNEALIEALTDVEYELQACPTCLSTDKVKWLIWLIKKHGYNVETPKVSESVCRDCVNFRHGNECVLTVKETDTCDQHETHTITRLE